MQSTYRSRGAVRDSGMALGIAAFGAQGAGVAALGTAIGVPLWVISGAGASLAGVLLEELKRRGV